MNERVNRSINPNVISCIDGVHVTVSLCPCVYGCVVF